MKSWLYPGARVVVVSYRIPTGSRYKSGVLLPVIGVTYKVRDVKTQEAFGGEDWSVWTLLDDFCAGYTEAGGEIWIPAVWLAPVTNTDAAITAMRELMQKARNEKRVTVDA